MGIPALPLLFSLILCCHETNGVPVSKGVADFHIVTTYLPSYATVLISLGALLLLAYFILGCVCCPNKSIKALSYQNGFPVSRLNENNFENPSEITIFPPHSTVIDLQPVSPSFPGFEEKVTFEPLPDILPKKFTSGQSAACSSRPAHFNALLKSKVSLHDWFDDPNSNFPREQLQYLQEIGIGWFGRVVEGEASQICDNEEKTAVIVKILREDASPSEHLHFLHEVRSYRDLKHSNVIKLLGRCLESDPFLLIMEHSISDLKTYLVKQEKIENFVQDGLMLQMISNIASGLRYMHDKGFCHMDLAAHNCFICSDNSVKIGDYGVSFDRWKGDYYCLGEIALPLRWYAPEILKCSESTIETKEITKEANVWAFGIVLWEIVTLGKLPYEELSDEEVLQKVLIEKNINLCPPTFDIICKDEIVLVMKECWKPKKYRPVMEKIESFISQLYNDRLSIKNKELSFEERWNSIQPRITEISSYTGTESSSLKFENDFSTRSDLQNYSSDNEILSSFEMSFDILPKSGFNAQLSPSLNVLNGSIDELTENDAYLNSISLSCGKYDADTLSNISDKDNFQMEEDKDNVLSNNVISDQISAAIKDLDLVLANQPDSSKNSTLQKCKPVLHDSEITLKNRESYANVVLKESQHLSKSSDMSNISENSFSKSSNFSDHVDNFNHDKSNELSINSDLNGNCDYHNTNANKKYDEGVSEIISEPDRYTESSLIQGFNNYSSVNVTNKICGAKTESEEINAENNFSNCDQKLSLVPDIVIHESPSINPECSDNFEPENDHNYSENNNISKTFRFVFKDITEIGADEISHQDFKNELNYDLTESLKKCGRSKPLTSTPVKSNLDSCTQSPAFLNSDVTENNSNNDVFCESIIPSASENFDHKVLNNTELNFENSCDIKAISSPEHLNSNSDLDISNKSSDLQNCDSNQETVDSTDLEHFTTAQSSLCLSKSDNIVETKISENSFNEETYLHQTKDNITLKFNDTIAENGELLNLDDGRSNNSTTYYISADSSVLREDYSKVFSDVISPPNGYDSSSKDMNYSVINNDVSSDYLEDSKASETVSPPQAFQDNGLSAFNDSCSESKTSFDQEFSTSAECGSSENLDQYLEDDHISQANISAAKLLETSFPEVESKSFTYETCADFSGNMRPRKNNSGMSVSDYDKKTKLYDSDYGIDHHHNYNLYKSLKPSIQSYDQMIVEDLDTGEQTVINESYSVCDDYENSGESDEILKINTETDEAIIVDSSEALIGFVPSRSIELLQEFEVIPPMNPTYAMDEEKESSDSMNVDAYNSASPSPAAMKHNSSPYESPEPAYLQPYRNFCLQNEVIEEEITDEIVSPSSYHSSSSYCSNEIFMDEEKMSQSSESVHRGGEMYETSVMPSVDHLYIASDDGSKTDVSSSECSPVKQNDIVNAKYRTDAENNHISNDQEDVMHSFQPSHSVRWLSDETLDVDGDDQSPIIIEGREILAGDIIQTCELTAEDIASALSQLEAKSHLHGLTPNHLNVSQSPSPFSSVESSPCRDTVYTPDFESDSEETGSGTSCSSTSGSFECIHNKFKNAVDISKVVDESDKSASSREQSPMKIFSKTWDCHATPTRGVLVTPEKKFNSMRKSVSFHEEDPQVVFEYPPASDSSEDGYPSDDNEEFCRNIDYLKYADWDLQVADVDDIEAEEIVEIEELDSEPYVRRPAYSSSSLGPLNRPMLYTLTTGFSDEDFDLSETVSPSPFNAPSNSPEEEKVSFISGSQMCELIQSQLSNLSEKENVSDAMGKKAHNQHSSSNPVKEGLSIPMTSVQKSVVTSVDVDDIVIDELLPECQFSENVTVQKGSHSDINNLNISDDEEVIVEELELSEDDSDSESFEFNKENRPIVLETDSEFCYNAEFLGETSSCELLGENSFQSFKPENIDVDVSCSYPSHILENIPTRNTHNPSNEIIKENESSNCENIDSLVYENKADVNNVEYLSNLTNGDHDEETVKECSSDSKNILSGEKSMLSKALTCENVGFDNGFLKTNFAEDENTLYDNFMKSENPNFSDLLNSAPKKPVHVIKFESENNEVYENKADVNNVEYLSNLTNGDHDEETVKECSSNSKNVLSGEKSMLSEAPACENVGFDNGFLKTNFAEDENTLYDNFMKSENPNFSDLLNSAPKKPVHVIKFESENNERSVIETSIEISVDCPVSPNLSNNSSNAMDNPDIKSEIPAQSNLVTTEENMRIKYPDNNGFIIETVKSASETNNIFSNNICSSSQNHAENSDILSNKLDFLNTSHESDVIVTDLISIETEDNKSHVSDYSALTNNDKTSIFEEENIAQGVSEPKCSSSSGLADLSEAFCSPIAEKETVDVQEDDLMTSEDKSLNIKSNSEDLVGITFHFDTKETVTVNDSKSIDNSEPLLQVPKIIVTPASESGVDDELEEYLREQLEHYHSEVTPQEDFSVTSEFSSRPFDDVFGSYISGDSSDYIEAFNFEFENGNFFEDYVDDYSPNLQTDVHDRLFPDNGRQKRSSSLPLMTENLSDDDSLTMKSDSSLIYDSSKGITHL